MGQARDDADIPHEIPMLQVCQYFNWTPDQYYALDNATAEWAHALVLAEGRAAKQ